MCQLLFVASDQPLPEVPWNAEAQAFHVRPAEPGEEAVRSHLTKTHVYYVGSHEGCGCGFSAPELPIEDQFDYWQHESAVQSSAQLRQYLSENVGPFSSVEIYVAWNGNLNRRAKRRVSLSVAQLSESTFLAEEPILVYLTGRHASNSALQPTPTRAT